MLVVLKQINLGNGWPKSEADDEAVAVDAGRIVMVTQRNYPEPHVEVLLHYSVQLSIKVRGTVEQFVERIKASCEK